MKFAKYESQSQTFSKVCLIMMTITFISLYLCWPVSAYAAEGKELWEDTNPAEYNSYASEVSRQDSAQEAPGFFAMTADLLVARPVMLAMTVVGTVVFIVSSPFSAMGGNIKQAADTLVRKPAGYTFSRCLGCTELDM